MNTLPTKLEHNKVMEKCTIKKLTIKEENKEERKIRKKERKKE